MKSFPITATALATALLLSACGSENNNNHSNIMGIAAVGAPISGANVSAKCKNGLSYPATGTVSTGTNGAYTLVVPSTAFPCVVQSSGGNVTSGGSTRSAPTLHSVVASSANTRANITPLTDIITALTLKKGGNTTALESWFNSAAGSAELDTLASGLTATQNDLISALAAQGFDTGSLPAGFNAITGNIVPATATNPTGGDSYDKLLDALQDALGATAYSSFLTTLVNACTAASCGSSILEDQLPEATDPVEPEEPVSELGNDSGVTALIDGVRYTTKHIKSYTGAPLSIGTGYLDAGNDGETFRANISGIVGILNNTANCQNHGIPGVTLTLNGISYYGTPDQGGSCNVKTTSYDTSRIVVSFSGQLKRTVESYTAPEYINVTNGEFQYIVKTFSAGNGAPLVNASFEGATAGGYYQNNPLAISVGDFGWAGPWTNVNIVNANPALEVTPAGGSLLSGGSSAISWLGDHKLEKVFSGDVYVSFLIRWPQPQPGRGLVANRELALSNLAVYVGVRNGKFVASMGDTPDKKFVSDIDVVAGTTYHVVGRLRKTAGASDYNQMTLWVNPALNGEANPTGTATHSSQGTGAMRYMDKISLQSGGNNSPDPLVDRIRLSDTWDGLFEEAED